MGIPIKEQVNLLKRKPLTIKQKMEKGKLIIEHVNNFFNVECKSLDRVGFKVLPRQFAMYYIRHYTNLPFSRVGMLFPSSRTKSGHKDHATVMHAYYKIKDLIKIDKELRDYDNELKEHCEKLAKLSADEILKYKAIAEINDTLNTFDLEQIRNVNKYLLNQ